MAGRKGLIVVDVQNDFCEGGSLAVEGGTDVARRIRKLLQESDYDVRVATLDFHDRNGDNGGHFGTEANGGVDFVDRWPAHCVEGSDGAGFKDLDPEAFAEIFVKGKGEPAYSGFQGTGQITGQSLTDFLRKMGVTHVDVVGIAFDYCVKATALDAVKADFATTVLDTFTASVDPTKDLDTLAALEAGGVTVVPGD